MDSLKAAKMFEDKSFDIVYLDAEHDADSLKADIDAWLPKTRYILAGHDYGHFPGVTETVKEKFKLYQTEGTVWKTYV